jgi:hypothetical protein
MAIPDAGILNHRELAVLRAVADGRCEISADAALLIDGAYCAHQFLGRLLRRRGLITAARSGAAQLTEFGRALLDDPGEEFLTAA